LNFGLSPDFSVQLKVLLSESLSERLIQKLKVTHCLRSETMLLWSLWYLRSWFSVLTFCMGTLCCWTALPPVWLMVTV